MVELGVLEHWQCAESEALLWERRLSNIGQLAELLQAQSVRVSGLLSLLHWFAKQLVEDNAELGKDRQIRLESDDELVRIVTIHSSKGLEYPVVFIPFLFSGKELKQPLWYYDDAGQLTLSLAPDASEKSAAGREALAEDCRLLYVALTRTKYRCYIGASEFKGRSLDTSATGFGHLLLNKQSPDTLDEGWLRARLEELGAHNAIDYTYWGNEDLDAFFNQTMRVEGSTSSTETILPKRLAPDVKSDWRVHSFTGLMNEHHRLHPEVHAVVKPLVADVKQTNQIHILNFPKGSHAGTFLHTLFEHTDFQSGNLIDRFARSGESLQEHISQLLVRKQLVSEFKQQAWAEYLAEWVQRILALDLSANAETSLRLKDLGEEDRLVEAEFVFRVSELAAQELNITLNAFRENLPPLGFEQFRGHIKGAIDLTFRHDGRYYLLDYKSNHLGFEAADYAHAKLETAMIEHRYDVQYLLYTVALHRLLRQRMGEHYDYDMHFGGVYYLFLRGMELEEEVKPIEGGGVERRNSALPGVYFVRPEKALIERLDTLMNGSKDAEIDTLVEGVTNE
jgi:exodeoxyribonuclease V beta subunit